MVNSDDELIVDAVVWGITRQIVYGSREVWYWIQQLESIRRYGRYSVDGDDVIHERLSEARTRIDIQGVEDLGAAGEITLTLRCRRNCVEAALTLHDAQPFVRTEEKRLVLNDRSANAASELVLAISGLLLCHIEVVSGIQFVVPQEFEETSVKFIGSRFGDEIDLGTGPPSLSRRSSCFAAPGIPE